MRPISVNDSLPADKTYVLARYTGGNWHDSDHQSGCVWQVVKFVRGLSLKERQSMPDCTRKRRWHSEDEGMNNERPYCWDSFGPGCLFGQAVDCWLPLPE